MQVGPHAPKEGFSVQPRFAAYRVDNQGVRFILPGRAKTDSNNRQIVLEYRHGEDAAKQIPLEWNGRQWELPEGTRLPNKQFLRYRFLEQQPDQPDKVILDHTQIKDGFNYIPANSSDPAGLGPTLLLFRDSVVSPEQLDEFTRLMDDGDNVLSKRTFYNQLGGSEQSNPFLRRLYQLFGIQVVEDRPLIGGDMLSAHGYWTSSLFQPNSKISSSAGFEKVALENLQDGARMCFDGAFVNEGFNGIHYLSNLYYGTESPFLHWFNYGNLNQFPYQPLQLGILPVKTDPVTGEDVPNNEAWNVRVLEPQSPRNPENHYFIELYDPRLEDAAGNKLLLEKTRDILLTNSQDSIQNYRFPVPEKIGVALKETAAIKDPNKRAQAIHEQLNQGKFGLTISIHDNSGYNWDGQRDVKKINVNHQDVVDYIKDACVYWTDKVDRLYTAKVAEALTQAHKQSGPMNYTDALKAVDAVTKKHLGDPNGILPALDRKGVNGEVVNPVTLDSIKKTLADYQAAKREQKLPASKFIVRDLEKNFHPGTLPAPPMLQVHLNTPRMKEILTESNKPLWLETFTAIFQPVFALIDNIFPNAKPAERFIDSLTPRSFMEQLEKKLEKSLTPALKAKLKDPVLGHLFYEEIGRSIFLSLLTNRFIAPNASDNELDPKVLAQRFARNIPPYITQAVPNQGAKLLSELLLERLKKFDTAQLNAPLTVMLSRINPESAAVARHVLHQRNLGLHWRIDALKDLGDMDGVRAEPDELRTARLFKEVNKIKDIMTQIGDGVRNVFPKSVIKAEITDFHLLTSQDKVNELLAFLMKGNIINGIPNFNWFFATGHKAVGMAPRPEGEGEAQVGVNEFIQKMLKPMMRVLPMEQALMFQNMTSSHDMSTSLFGLALHPHQARYDHYSWLELNARNEANRGIFHLALNELQHKSQLGFLSNGLPPQSFDKLRQLARKDHVIAQLSADIQPYLESPDKRPDDIYKRPTPLEIKGRYIDELFNIIKPAELDLNAQQHEQLRQSLKVVIQEPSEVKAMRGRISNSFLQLRENPDTLAQLLGGDRKRAESILNDLGSRFDKALWELTQSIPDKHRRWIGYQQIDRVIDWTVQRLPQSVISKDKQAQKALKQAMYLETIRPALEQYKRIVALQTAVPGDPTFYLPDLLGQAGGEDLKNMFLGNRELIRHDWLKTDLANRNVFNDTITQYFTDLGNIVRQRHENAVLNNGHLELPLDPERSEAERSALAGSPILPLIRDNGENQAICLVNFGNPDDAWQSWMNTQTQPRYPQINSNTPKVWNYSLDLKHLGIPVNTVYKSVDPESQGEEYYIVNNNYRLVRQDDPSRGIDVGIARTLIRVS